MHSLHTAMPIGITDFKVVRESCYYVDKSRFIGEILRKKGRVTLITRPRRFGKTLALSMLAYFCTIKNAEKNRVLFNDLEIASDTSVMKKQGTYPTIFLSLKDLGANSYELMLDLFKDALHDIFQPFTDLLESNALDNVEKDIFRQIYTLQGKEADLRLSLKRLIQLVYKYYGKKVVLLIDEYDLPIQTAIQYGYYEQCINFMQTFLGACLKDNIYLELAVLTGVQRISKESIFSGINNLDVHTVLSGRYNDIFGLTQNEVSKILNDLGYEDKENEIKDWYDGYQFGKYEIYNPWSVLQYIDNDCVPKTYWINTSENSILIDSLKFITDKKRINLEEIILGKTIPCQINENFTYRDMHKRENALWMMLLASGYLKTADTYQNHDRKWMCHLQIPNYEICSAYEDEILTYISVDQNMDLDTLKDLTEALITGDAAKLQKTLKNIFYTVLSTHDLPKSRENLYHLFLLGLFFCLNKRYIIRSNRESGSGRFDIAFFPIDKKDRAILIELKRATSKNSIQKAAKEALLQIEKNNYTAEFSAQGITDVLKYGIAFSGKEIGIEKDPVSRI